MKQLSVVIPVKNEEESIRPLIERIHATLSYAMISYEIIVIDDHSTDSTVSRVRSLQKKYNIKLHTKKGEGGKAYSMLEGSRVSSSMYIAMIDGDLQYPPEALASMYQVATNNDHGVVVANRKNASVSLLRKIGTKMSYLVFEKLLHGFNCDTQSGLKIFKKEIISYLSEDDVTPWTLDMPLLKVAQELGETIGTYDIDFAKRVNGESKINFIKAGTEIALASFKLKLKGSSVYKVHPDKSGNSNGAGYRHKGKKYVTHTQLPHHKTALTTFYPWQKVVLFALLLIALAGLLVNAKATLIVVVAALTFLYFVDFIFSLFVLSRSLHNPEELRFTDKEIRQLDGKQLPIYTILCPLYKEARILPHFVDAMKSLDWPKKKLEVLLLLEEDDDETLAAAKKLKLPKYFKIVVVPHSYPKTKPKACNYGFNLSNGEYVVIYDAEDQPDPLQLKKAYLGFMKTHEKVVCLQSKLNYFNSGHNLLTRIFTAEYSLWFDLVLPGLQSVRGPLPLGGTSNHFKSKILRELHAWDPFNVTEDCDLGVRIFKEKYQTAMIDSTTYEEANSSYRSWLKQRSRWIKGYLQTYLVHVRNPLEFVRTHGIGALMFHLVIGMRMVFVLINPIFWATTIAYFALYPYVGLAIESLYPPLIFYPAATMLVFANFIHFFNYMIGCMKREKYELVKYVFFIPVYWIMTSWAALIAFYQLFTKPHYWEKTTHGLHLIESKVFKLSLPKITIAPSFGVTRSKIPTITPARVGGIILVAAAMAANVINFVYSTYLGRRLSIEEFGNISFFGSILSFSAIVVYAISRSVTVETAKYFGSNSKPNKYIWKQISSKSYYIFAALMFSWIVLSPALSSYFQISDVMPFILFSPTVLFFALYKINTGYMTGTWGFKQVALLTFVESIVKLVAALAFVEGGSAQYVYAALPLSMIVSFVISDQIVRKTEANESIEEDVLPKKFFATSVLANISIMAFISLDVILAKRLLTPTEAGHYALISLVGKTIYLLGSLFTQFVTPVVSKVIGEKRESVSTFYKILGATSVVTVLGYVFVGLLGGFTIPLLFGEKSVDIVGFLPMFGLAMVAFTLSSAVVNYHQLKDEYIFPIIGFIFTFIMVGTVSVYGTNLARFVSALTIVILVQGFVIFLLHIFESSRGVLQNNFEDLYDLLFGKQQVSQKGKKKLKILVLNWRDTKHVWAGGSEVYVHEIAKRWTKEGHLVTVFCGNDGNNPRNEKIDGVQMVRRGGFYTVYFWAALYYLLRFRGKYDVIVDCENGIPFFTPIYARIPKVLLIHHVHQDVLRQHLRFPFSSIAIFLEGKLMPYLYKRTEVVTVSESSKNSIEKLGFDSRNTLQVITPGYKLEKQRKTKKTKHPSFIYLGRLQHYKNIDVAIKAFAKITKKYANAHLTIAGFGESESDLKALVSDLSLNSNVTFTGYVSEKQKCKLLSESWVSLQPSSCEGWGITVIEANASGTPVIASNTAGLKDSVIDGKTGYLIEPGNSTKLSKAMVKMVSNKRLRTNMSKQALLWSKNFTWDKSANTFLSILYRQTDYDYSQVIGKSLALD